MKTYISVSMSDGLKMFSESKNAVLLDVRRPEEYQSGHIPGAVLFTNETMTSEKASNLIPSKNTEVFVYCRSGRRSKAPGIGSAPGIRPILELQPPFCDRWRTVWTSTFRPPPRHQTAPQGPGCRSAHPDRPVESLPAQFVPAAPSGSTEPLHHHRLQGYGS